MLEILLQKTKFSNFQQTFKSRTPTGFASERKETCISWTSSSPNGRGFVTSSAISLAASSNYNKSVKYQQ